MSYVEYAFLHAPLHDAIHLYKKEIAPILLNNNKVIAIVAALSLIYFIQDRVLKPPSNLRHLPYLSCFGVIKSMSSKESFWSRCYNAHLPIIDAKNSKGLFMEMSRLGWTVQVANPEDAKRVLSRLDLFPKAALIEGDKDSLIGKFIIGPNIVMLDGHNWKSQRKIANPAFRRSMPVKLFGNLTLQMFKVMEDMDDVVNVSDLMERWTLDAIGKAGFGFNFDAIQDRDSEWVVRYHRISHGLVSPIFFLLPIFDTKFRWMFPERQKIHDEMDRFTGMLDKVIQHKKEMIKNGIKNDALEENEKDLLTLFIESGEENHGVLSDKELMSNLCVFFLAGHDTTSSALSFAIHYLAQDQEVQRKAREEVIYIMGDEPYDVLPTVEDTKKMKYINQIMKETLRINCAVPKTSDRVASEDTYLSNTFIPKGTPLTVNIFDIQHSKKVWKDPHKFDPERFAEGGEAERLASEGLTGWLPFGNGTRQCIGMNFSLNEQRVLISMLLRKFTWSTPPNSKHKDGVITGGFPVNTPLDLDIAFSRRY